MTSGRVLVLLILALLGLPTSVRPAAAARRRECLEACADTILQCASSCSRFGQLNASCRRAVLARCRREGPQVCATPTTTVTTSTTTTSLTPLPTTTTTIPPGDRCSTALPLTVGMNVSGNTAPARDDLAGTCVGNNSPDLVYTFTAPSSGTLTFTLVSSADLGLHVRTVCSDPETEIGCVDQQGGGVDEVLSIDVDMGVSYAVVVDGYDTAAGSFTLMSDLQ